MTVGTAQEDEDGAITGDIGVIRNPKFVTNAQGDGLPQDDELVFDTAPVSVPLNEIVSADDEYDNVLFQSLNDSRQLVVKPPEGYDRTGYEDEWEPLRWSDISDTGGAARVGPVGSAESENGRSGTRVTIEVDGAIPYGQYTVWVVKFAALSNPGEFSGANPFVSPAGNALVGFQNLGRKFDGPAEAENQFVTDASGAGSIDVVNEGGPLSGVPGYRPLGDDPVEDGPVPFVGTVDDYDQSPEELGRVASDLRSEDQIAFVGAYHYDDQTWGVYPGPWHLNQFGVNFVFS